MFYNTANVVMGRFSNASKYTRYVFTNNTKQKMHLANDYSM